MAGKFNWNDSEDGNYKDLLKTRIEVLKDCDIDCQKSGSGMAWVALLNQIVLGLIGLNALFMFIGVWRSNFRVCSVYCTMAMCVIQLVVLILSAVMLFSSYTMAFCATSLTPVAPGLPWTMADDYSMNV